MAKIMHYKNCLKNMKSDDFFLVRLAITTITVDSASSEPTGFLSVTRHERSVMDRNPVGSDDIDSVDIYS